MSIGSSTVITTTPTPVVTTGSQTTLSSYATGVGFSDLAIDVQFKPTVKLSTVLSNRRVLTLKVYGNVGAATNVLLGTLAITGIVS